MTKNTSIKPRSPPVLQNDSIFNPLNHKKLSSSSSHPSIPKGKQLIVLVEKLSHLDTAWKVKSDYFPSSSSSSCSQKSSKKSVKKISDLLGLKNNYVLPPSHITQIKDDDQETTVLTTRPGQTPPMKCYYCGDEYVTKRKLKNHMALSHLTLMAFKCYACLKKLKSQTGLGIHEQPSHTEICASQTEKTLCQRRRGRSRISITKNKSETFPLDNHDDAAADAAAETKPSTKSQSSEEEKMVYEDFEKQWWACRLCFRGFFGLTKLVQHKFVKHSEQNDQFHQNTTGTEKRFSSCVGVGEEDLLLTGDDRLDEKEGEKMNDMILRPVKLKEEQIHLPNLTIRPDTVLEKMQLSDVRLQLNRVQSPLLDQISNKSNSLQHRRMTAIGCSRVPWTRRQRALGIKFDVNFSPPPENVFCQEPIQMPQENVKRKSPPPPREQLKITIKRVNRTRCYVCSNRMEYAKKMNNKKFGQFLLTPP